MKNESRNTELPGAPAWFQSSLPSAPVWFQSSAERIEFETTDNEPHNDGFNADEPDFVELDTAEATGTIGPNAEFERQSSAATASEAQSIRVRDVMLGGVAAPILFAVFSVGFLSRGLMMPTRDSGFRPVVEATSEIPVQRPNDAVPSLIAARSNPAASTVMASVSAPKLPQPEVGDQVEPKAAASPDQPPPQLKLSDPLPHSIMAKPTPGTLKMTAAQPVSLNLAMSTAQSATDGQIGQCSGPPQGPVQGEFGTKIAWADTPDESWQLARDQSKLVFMMHVSGNFEKPGFT